MYIMYSTSYRPTYKINKPNKMNKNIKPKLMTKQTIRDDITTLTFRPEISVSITGEFQNNLDQIQTF